MIRYEITREDLGKMIEAAVPGWLDKAAQRTELFAKAGTYDEKSSIWSDVKGVYMQLQGREKCIYCERKLEATELGKIEQDVEHFRPKSNVRAWKLPQELVQAGVQVTDPDNDAGGYYLLPYDIFNYSASCKPCNSVLKKDYFPIAGRYQLNGKKPEALLAKEKPLLLYPIGNFDVDPEALIGFHGVSPQALARSGYERDRALTTISFFRLDDFDARKNLFRERALVIVALFPWLEILSNNPRDPTAKKIVGASTADSAPHASCARSYRKLYDADPATAKDLFDKAGDYIVSIS